MIKITPSNEILSRIVEISQENSSSPIIASLTHLGTKERRFFEYLKKKKITEFTPVEMARVMKVTNRTIINWCATLAKNGLIEPNLTGKRIRSYSVTG